MKIFLKDISVEPLGVPDFYVARMRDREQMLSERSSLEVIFFLDVFDNVLIERIDETFDGVALTWEETEASYKKTLPYIAQRIKMYLFKHPEVTAPMEVAA